MGRIWRFAAVNNPNQVVNATLLQDLKSRTDSLRSELIELLRELIRIRSYSGAEREIVEFIVSAMKRAGFDEARADKMGNAVGRIGSGPVKILYDAHVDTVQVTDENEWSHPPFAAALENGKIYGRGAVDEKPALAGFLVAAQAILKCCPASELPFTLYVVGSVMEEDCDGAPLLHLIEREGIRPDFVVLGEPTDLAVYRGQRGRMEIEIVTQGKSAHGAHNERGVNAVNKMIPILSGIERLDKSLSPKPPLGKGSITTSRIESRAPSLCSVPDWCRIHLDRRLTLGETRESALEELKNIARKSGVEADIAIPEYRGTSWTGHEVRQEAYFPTWLTDEDHPLVQAAVRAASEALGKPARTSVWSFSTNGVATSGRLKIPTIGFAPGREELAHSRDEEVAVDDLAAAARFYALFPFVLADMIHSMDK
jgi:putative selenium metabolism hydrolase